GYGSTPGEAMAGSASRDKIPIMQLYCYASPAGYEPRPQFYSAGFGTITEDFMAPAKWFIQNWKENRKPKLGTLALGVPSWRTISDPKGAQAHVEKLGGEFVGVEWLPMICTDTTVELKRLIEEKKADFIMVFGAMAHSIVVAKDLARLGVDLNKVTVVNNACSIDESFIKAIPKEAEGLYGTNYFSLPSEDAVPGVQVAKKIAAWRGLKPADVNKTYIEGIACSYTVEKGLTAALEKKGYKDLTNTDIKDVFFNLKDIQLDGLLPSLTVRDPNYPGFFNWMRIARITKGEYKLVSDWLEIPQVTDGGR
ncbi:MAG: ABC transporter substrate-binding protein, partial [Pseudomonadota bacterium]